MKESGFSSTGRPDDADELAGFDGERKVFEDWALVVFFGEAVDDYHGLDCITDEV